jgi:hypothetical protein
MWRGGNVVAKENKRNSASLSNKRKLAEGGMTAI